MQEYTVTRDGQRGMYFTSELVTEGNNRISAAMAKHGLTAETLASELGMSMRVVSGRLNGRTQWKLTEMVDLVEQLNSLGGEYTIDGLFFGVTVEDA